MKLKLLTTLALLLMAVSGAWALTPKAGDTWDEGTKTLTVNSNPGSSSYSSKTEIEHLIISASVTTIGSFAFQYCTNLTSVTFAAGSLLESIDSYAFYGSGLTSVSIPASVTTIESQAFYNCSSLTSVTFATGSQLESIGFCAFYGSGLTSISIPASVTTIGSSAFYNCTNLTSVTFAAGSLLESIDSYAFYNCSSLTSVTIPASVTTIKTQTFYKCSSLTSVTIPASVTTIESQAFYNCSSLTSVTFAAGSLLVSIGSYAFAGCNNASLNIIIPASVTSVGTNAFEDVAKVTGTVTQGNFDSYFDASGNLLNATTFDGLIFKGNFADLVDYILLDRSITITGDNAVLNNMGFVIVSDDVSLNNMTLVSNTDLGYLIYVEASNVTLDKVSVTYNAPNEVEAKAIFANDADNFILINSEITFTGANPGEDHYRGLEVRNCDGAVIDNNTITATFPAVPVNWAKTGIDQDLVLAVGIQGGNDVEFTNNSVTVNTNGDVGSYPTIDAVMVYSSDDILIKGNDITHVDNTTENGARYYYSLDIYSTTGTVEANNINVNTIGTGTAGIDRSGSAFPIQLTGPFTVTVKDNNITAISKGPIAGIYATNWPGESNLTAENNIINVTGYATTDNYALVAGIEAEIDKLKASNNTITVDNAADYDDANQVIGVGIGTSWFSGDASADIKYNDITVDGKYAVYYAKAKNTNVTGNNLIAHELIGDAAVYIASGSGNKVENNGPITLFAAGSTNQWMTWCSTEELATPENVTVYTVSGVDNNSITLNDITSTASVGTQTMKVIPAYTPVLIYRATVGNDAVDAMLNAAGTVPESGYDSATGIVTSSTTGCTFYGTTKDLSNIPTANYTADRTYVLYGERFLLCKDNAGIGANKCWLVLNAPNGSRQLSIGIGSDNNTTGIQTPPLTPPLEGRGVAGEWYSLDGRKLNGQPTRKGLYIYKGKKVVIK